MTYIFMVNTNTGIGIIKYVHTYTLPLTDCVSKALQLKRKYFIETLI
jgi:hypothetical protein